MIQKKFSYWNSTYKDMVVSNIARAKNIETSKDGNAQVTKIKSETKPKKATHLVPAKTKKKLNIKYQVKP